MTFTAHPWQQAAIAAFTQQGGLFCAMPQGAGKSYVGAECYKKGLQGLAVVPSGGLVAQTEAVYRNFGITSPRVAGYLEISSDESLLETLQPDPLILDEASVLKNVSKAAWSKRIARYLHKHPQCRVAVLSGSVMHKSAKDYIHLLAWSLRSQFPRTRAGLEALVSQADAQPEAWLDRLRSTPGCFLEAPPAWPGKLTIRVHKRAALAREQYERAVLSRTAPDGWPVEDRWSQEELCRQLAWGFYMRKDPRPPEGVVQARRAWARKVRDAEVYRLADTELGARSVYPEEYRAYLEATAGYAPREVVEWLAPPRVQAERGTLIWVFHRQLGEALSAAYGLPYHREKGYDQHGVYLGDQTAPVALCSISACHAGVDGAQRNYWNHYVLEPPSDARIWQQLLARLARQGQPRERVHCDVVIGCQEHDDALRLAMSDAEKIHKGWPQWLVEAEWQW